MGQCGFLLDFGDVRLVTDPYLSDYVDRNFYTAATPWQRRYPPPATLSALSPDGVLISHAHGDHLDPWTLGEYLQAGGGGVIAAPAPECGALKRLGAPNIVCAQAEVPFGVGRAVITPIPCAHTQLHPDEAGRYHELSYIIECGASRVFFGGDMSLYPGLEERLMQADCDVLLLPVNGRDAARTQSGIIGNIDCDEAAALAAALGKPFIPMHHDLYAINGATDGQIRGAAQRNGASVVWLKPGETANL